MFFGDTIRCAVVLIIVSAVNCWAQSGYEPPPPLNPTSSRECDDFQNRLDARAGELGQAATNCHWQIYNQCFRSGLSISDSNRCHDRNQGGTYQENTDCGSILYFWPRCRPLYCQQQCAISRAHQLVKTCRAQVDYYQQNLARLRQQQQAEQQYQQQYEREQQRQEIQAEEKLTERKAQADAISRGLARVTDGPIDAGGLPPSISEGADETSRSAGLLSTGDPSHDKNFQPLNDVKGITQDLATDRVVELLKKGLSSLTPWGRTVVATYDTGEHAVGVINTGLSVPTLWSRFAGRDSQEQLVDAGDIAKSISGQGSNPLSNIIMQRGIDTIIPTYGTQLQDFEDLGSTFFSRSTLSAQDSGYYRTTHVLQIPYIADTPNLTVAEEINDVEEVTSSTDTLNEFTAEPVTKPAGPSKQN
jgi:hypothetical protein